jgi:hypothetical protein
MLAAAVLLNLWSGAAVPSAVSGPAAPPPPIPPQLRIASPRYAITGSPDLTLGLLSSRGFSPDPERPPSNPVAYWNDQVLRGRHISGDLYEAYVPASLLATATVGTVTMRNNIGASTGITVVVTDIAPPLPAPPVMISLTAVPGVLGDASLTNTLTVRLVDGANAPATDARVVLAASDGTISASREQPDGDGTITGTLYFWPQATAPVTPVVTITAFALAPAAYTSATLTLGGEFIRYGTWFAGMNKAWPPTLPRPDNHAPCQAAVLEPWEPITVPADHEVDYYLIDSGMGLWIPPRAEIRLHEAPQMLSLRVYHVAASDCAPGPGHTPTMTLTLLGGGTVTGPYSFGLGYVASFCKYLLEVRNDGAPTQRTYTVSQQVFGVLFAPIACYGN